MLHFQHNIAINVATKMTTISAVILAGGQGKRMGGVDKGLQLLQGKPLIQHILLRLTPQISQISINANRNQTDYAQYGYPVFTDELTGFQGPLSGMLTGLNYANTDYVLFVPCDCPYLPFNLTEKLISAVQKSNVFIAYANDGERQHPTFCLIAQQMRQPLQQYLAQGQRKILQFFHQQQAIAVDFSEQKYAFTNINQWQELQYLNNVNDEKVL